MVSISSFFFCYEVEENVLLIKYFVSAQVLDKYKNFQINNLFVFDLFRVPRVHIDMSRQLLGMNRSVRNGNPDSV